MMAIPLETGLLLVKKAGRGVFLLFPSLGDQ